MKYTIQYYFDGSGSVDVEAQSEDEAREMFFSGEFTNEQESGDQYTIQTITKE